MASVQKSLKSILKRKYPTKPAVFILAKTNVRFECLLLAQDQDFNSMDDFSPFHFKETSVPKRQQEVEQFKI